VAQDPEERRNATVEPQFYRGYMIEVTLPDEAGWRVGIHPHLLGLPAPPALADNRYSSAIEALRAGRAAVDSANDLSRSTG
jgi:hypothetical protein